MKYYAHFGHKDFILCLGYKADAIKKYFLEYDECVTNDFVLSGGRQEFRVAGQGHSRLEHHFRGHGLVVEYWPAIEGGPETLARRRDLPRQLHGRSFGCAAAAGHQGIQGEQKRRLFRGGQAKGQFSLGKRRARMGR